MINRSKTKKTKREISKVRSKCKKCRVGSCCYEGVELTKNEMKRILQYNPQTKKPWFRLVEKHEGIEKEYPFTTIMRNSSCVFQNKNNQCLIYPVRPKHCHDFPFEDKQFAPYRSRLCSNFYSKWPNNAIKKAFKKREKK